MIDFKPGKYRLTQWTLNPEARDHSGEWFHVKSWNQGDLFYGYYRYAGVNNEIPAIYQGSKPETAVTSERLPRIFAALAPYLEHIK